MTKAALVEKSLATASQHSRRSLTTIGSDSPPLAHGAKPWPVSTEVEVGNPQDWL